MTGAKPWPPRLCSIQQDERGLLWTISRVPDPAWQPIATSTTRPRSELEARRGTQPARPDDSTFDTIVEVIDPERGALIAAIRLPQFVKQLFDGRYFFVWRDTPDGPSVTVWRLKLEG